MPAADGPELPPRQALLRRDLQCPAEVLQLERGESWGSARRPHIRLIHRNIVRTIINNKYVTSRVEGRSSPEVFRRTHPHQAAG
jgi:hypothetical protein